MIEILSADWDVQQRGDIRLSNLLFPRLLGQADKISIIHATQAWVPVHSVGQYWIDTSQDFVAALAAERPALGAVVALENQSRRGSEDVFPGFVSLIGSPSARNGFLNGMTAPFGIAGGGPTGQGRLIGTAGLGTLTHPRGQATFESFYSELERMDASQRSADPPWGKAVKDYNDFYVAARGMMYNPVVSQAFVYTDAERAAFGNTTFGDACLVARNMVTANRGTKFVHITFGGWDHHVNVYPNLRTMGPVLDNGVAGLIDSLANTPHPTIEGATWLDRTLIVMIGEFGRTPPTRYGPTGLNGTQGRDHYANVQCCVMAGGGVQGGRNIGELNADGSTVNDPGWSGRGRPAPAGQNVRMEDIGTTIYSALGINWTTEILDTPSRRVFQYINGGPNTVYKEIRELFF